MGGCPRSLRSPLNLLLAAPSPRGGLSPRAAPAPLSPQPLGSADPWWVRVRAGCSFTPALVSEGWPMGGGCWGEPPPAAMCGKELGSPMDPSNPQPVCDASCGSDPASTAGFLGAA